MCSIDGLEVTGSEATVSMWVAPECRVANQLGYERWCIERLKQVLRHTGWQCGEGRLVIQRKKAAASAPPWGVWLPGDDIGDLAVLRCFVEPVDGAVAAAQRQRIAAEAAPYAGQTIVWKVQGPGE